MRLPVVEMIGLDVVGSWDGQYRTRKTEQNGKGHSG